MNFAFSVVCFVWRALLTCRRVFWIGCCIDFSSLSCFEVLEPHESRSMSNWWLRCQMKKGFCFCFAGFFNSDKIVIQWGELRRTDFMLNVSGILTIWKCDFFDHARRCSVCKGGNMMLRKTIVHCKRTRRWNRIFDRFQYAFFFYSKCKKSHFVLLVIPNKKEPS